MGSHVGAAAMTPSSFLHGDVNRSPPIPVWSFSSGSASASSWRSNQDVSGGSIIAIPTTMRKPRLPPAKSWNRPSPLIFTEPKFRLAVFQKTGRSKIPQNRPVRPNKMPVHLHRRHGKKRTARQTSPCATPDKSPSPSPKQQTPSSSPATMPQSGGGGGGVLDLERHFAFYGAYHSNPVNVFIHALFVWPIFLTALLLLHLAAPSLHAAAVGAAVYGAFYVSLDRRSGAVAAVLCFLCWAASAAFAARLGYSVGCKVVLVAQLFCWTMQFIGHGVFEKRAPALLDNLVQAFLMAPYFVLLEILHKFSGYEPYPGFHANVQKLIDAKRKEWEDKKAKKRT